MTRNQYSEATDTREAEIIEKIQELCGELEQLRLTRRGMLQQTLVGRRIRVTRGKYLGERGRVTGRRGVVPDEWKITLEHNNHPTWKKRHNFVLLEDEE